MNAQAAPAGSTASGLVIAGLTVRFGGLTAVDGLDLRADRGVITGLIGPNGAGKTTTFHATSGVVTPDSGTVHLDGVRLDGLPSAARAQHGLGRTFQRMELCGSMTVAENVALGPEAREAGRRPWGQLWAPRRQQADVRERTDAALRRCGLQTMAARRVADLSSGQRRLVELARAIASGFDFLLLDEPSSGLDEAETSRFATILLDVVRTEGTGMLLVEHDMTLVRQVCRSIYVLDFGRLIYQGPTDEVLASPVVRSAYLGQEAA